MDDRQPGEVADMSYASPEFKELVQLSKRELQDRFLRGETPSIEALVGYEYRGYNHPPYFALAGIRTFVKGFFTVDAGDTYGYNTPTRQNGLDGEWVVKPSEEAPKRFGFYQVSLVDPQEKENLALHAVLLDYGKGGNKPWDPTHLIRDYLVRLEPGSDDLLLGKAHVALGPFRPSTNFFLLERYRPIKVTPQLPGRGSARRS